MSEQQDLISSMTEDERCLLRRFSSFSKTFLSSSAVISLLVGTFMKSLIYRHLKRIKLTTRPINFLVLIDQLVHHFCGTIFIAMNVVWMITDTSAAQLFEDIFRFFSVTVELNIK